VRNFQSLLNQSIHPLLQAASWSDIFQVGLFPPLLLGPSYLVLHFQAIRRVDSCNAVLYGVICGLYNAMSLRVLSVVFDGVAHISRDTALDAVIQHVMTSNCIRGICAGFFRDVCRPVACAHTRRRSV